MAINKFIGIGNITADAEIRSLGSSQVAKFGLAMNDKYRDKNDGSVKEVTEFINVEAWDIPGIHQYLLKGQQVYVEGSLRTDKWVGQDGVQRSAVKIRANRVQLLGSRPQPSAQQTPPPPQFNQQPSAPQYSQPAAPAQFAQQGVPNQYPAQNQRFSRPTATTPVPPPQYAPSPMPDDGDLPF